MRISRISRDTARVADAISPRNCNPRRLYASGAIENGRSALDITTRTRELHGDGGLDSDSALSSAPSDLEDTLIDPEVSIVSPTHKRKRDGIPRTVVGTEEMLETRTSLRAAAITVKPKKARRQPAEKIVHTNGAVEVEPPANWEEVYKLTAEMRSQVPAPVDTMGCESLANDMRYPARDRRLQTLVALMLSSQTKDTVTAAAMKNLQDNLPGGFTLESILAVPSYDLNVLISKVGFHNNKTKYIKATAEILRSMHSSDIPSTIEGLVSLPGVGPKMAYLCMSAAWGRDEGIGVDVHVHRITNLWGWHKTKTPEETRITLEAWLPRDKWHDINHLLVGFGQTWCPPVGRKCGECKLEERRLCPSVVVAKTVRQKIKREKVLVQDEEGDVEVKEEVVVKAEENVHEAGGLVSENSLGTQVLQDIEDIGGKSKRSRSLVS